MHVIGESPVSGRALLVQAICIDRSMNRPGMDLIERIVLVDDLYLVAVSLKHILNEGLVHARTERTLKIVIVDDGDLSVLVAADRASGKIDLANRIGTDVSFVQAGKGLSVLGDQEIDSRLAG